MSDKKYFVLLNKDGSDSDHVFVSKQPRGAALKAATRGHTNIGEREGNQQGPLFLWLSVYGRQASFWPCMASC